MTWCDISPLSSSFLDVSDPLQVGLRSDLKFNLRMVFNPVWGLIESLFIHKKMKSMKTGEYQKCNDGIGFSKLRGCKKVSV